MREQEKSKEKDNGNKRQIRFPTMAGDMHGKASQDAQKFEK